MCPITPGAWPNEVVKDWERDNLSHYGQYKGPDLTEYGFAYKRGDYVPVDKRYSAYTSWSHAQNAWGMAVRRKNNGRWVNHG